MIQVAVWVGLRDPHASRDFEPRCVGFGGPTYVCTTIRAGRFFLIALDSIHYDHVPDLFDLGPTSSCHLHDLPPARLGIVQLALFQREHGRIDDRLDPVRTTDDHLAILSRSEEEDLLRGKRDEEDGDVIFEDLAGGDLVRESCGSIWGKGVEVRNE